ncbi:MAG: hypothetical protein Q9164_005058, partial [Protoblastenia rupestris]
MCQYYFDFMCCGHIELNKDKPSVRRVTIRPAENGAVKCSLCGNQDQHYARVIEALKRGEPVIGDIEQFQPLRMAVRGQILPGGPRPRKALIEGVGRGQAMIGGPGPAEAMIEAFRTGQATSDGVRHREATIKGPEIAQAVAEELGLEQVTIEEGPHGEALAEVPEHEQAVRGGLRPEIPTEGPAALILGGRTGLSFLGWGGMGQDPAARPRQGGQRGRRRPRAAGQGRGQASNVGSGRGEASTAGPRRGQPTSAGPGRGQPSTGQARRG